MIKSVQSGNLSFGKTVSTNVTSKDIFQPSFLGLKLQTQPIQDSCSFKGKEPVNFNLSSPIFPATREDGTPIDYSAISRSCNLRNANLRGADLRKADLNNID